MTRFTVSFVLLSVIAAGCSRAPGATSESDAGGPGRPAQSANSKAPATSKNPKYLIFWSDPDRAGELAERVGMKGDGKTRLLGFGVPIPTFEVLEQLPNLIRRAFSAGRAHDMAVMLYFDFQLIKPRWFRGSRRRSQRLGR